MCKTMLQSESSVDDIQIRRYRASDVPYLQATFGASMRTLIPFFVREILTTPVIGMSIASLLATTAYGIKRLERSREMPSWVAMVATAVAAILPYLFLHRHVHLMFDTFLQNVNEDDLSEAKIGKVYGGKGCFLVADWDGQIVGTVGGEDKGDGVIELRRMCVSPHIHSNGLGKRLIRQLELETNPSTMILFCSSVQKPAHRLYGGSGFVLLEKFRFDTQWLFQGIQIWGWEKQYNDNTKSVVGKHRPYYKVNEGDGHVAEGEH